MTSSTDLSGTLPTRRRFWPITFLLRYAIAMSTNTGYRALPVKHCLQIVLGWGCGMRIQLCHSRPFRSGLETAVKAAANLPLLFRQLEYRRILHTNIELVLELLAGRAEFLFSYCSAHAVGRRLAFNERLLPAVHARAAV